MQLPLWCSHKVQNIWMQLTLWSMLTPKKEHMNSTASLIQIPRLRRPQYSWDFFCIFQDKNAWISVWCSLNVGDILMLNNGQDKNVILMLIQRQEHMMIQLTYLNTADIITASNKTSYSEYSWQFCWWSQEGKNITSEYSCHPDTQKSTHNI